MPGQNWNSLTKKQKKQIMKNNRKHKRDKKKGKLKPGLPHAPTYLA